MTDNFLKGKCANSYFAHFVFIDQNYFHLYILEFKNIENLRFEKYHHIIFKEPN